MEVYVPASFDINFDLFFLVYSVPVINLTLKYLYMQGKKWAKFKLFLPRLSNAG